MCVIEQNHLSKIIIVSTLNYRDRVYLIFYIVEYMCSLILIYITFEIDNVI